MSCKMGLTEPRSLTHDERNDNTCYNSSNDVVYHCFLLNIPWAIDQLEVF